MSYSAPGKLFLFGEYAVLRGAPAVVTAVDRRVCVSATGDADYRVLGTSAPDAALPLAVEAVTGRAVRGWQVDLRAMFEGTQKLGLGSSAASCVALTAAVLETDDADGVFGPAFDAHLAFQRGSGSGADVAASTYGGTVAVRKTQGRPSVRRLGVDGALHIYPVWTGQSANTRDFVAAVNTTDTTAQLRALIELAEAGIEVFDGGASRDVLDLVRRYDAAMGALGEAAEIPIRTDVHAALVRGAEDIGAACKPSGAGGGDVSLVFSSAPIDPARLHDILPPGARSLDLRLGVPGIVSFSDRHRSC